VLQIMAASFAFGGLAGGARAQSSGYSEIVPYVNQPTGLTPTMPLSYASATLLDGVANGVLVTTIDGRPIKIEGNPDHPWSRGGTDVFGQASVLGLYDPDRSQAVTHLGDVSDWDTFHTAMLDRFGALRSTHGHRAHLLTGPVTSPTLIAQIQHMQSVLPELHWHVHAPAGRDAVYAGANAAFGKPLETQWNFDKADLIVSLDGDFLDAGPQQVGASRAWVDARRRSTQGDKLLTMHGVAPTPTLTYAKADHHMPVAQRDLLSLAQSLLEPQDGDGPLAQWRSEVIVALQAARGRSIVLTGTHQSAELHAVVHRINAALGNIGSTVVHTEPVLAQAEPFKDLVDAIRRGEVDVLVMLDTNPAYTAPADAEFTRLLSNVGLKVHAGLHADETAAVSDWHVPLLHPLESWGDARSLDGTATLVQPTIEPLYNGRSATEILSMLMDAEPQAGYNMLRAFWRQQMPNDFETAWRQTLLSGFVRKSAFPVQDVKPTSATADATGEEAKAGLEILIRPDPTVWDGSFANNAWLQELPKPVTQTVWENVIAISPRLAAQHKLKNGDTVVVEAAKLWTAGPVWIQPGQHDTAITLRLGYGRRRVGSVGEGIGYDAYSLRTFAASWRLADATLRRAQTSESVATTQQLDHQEGHDYVRLQPHGGKPVGDNTAFIQPTLYKREESDGRAWGMVIDLDACIGCNACVAACQAENNVPVVGKEQVLAGRDMHWLRVDRYYTGADENPDTRFMPVPCMHCEAAPCELGCPVEATLHDAEGLNLMVYNRCIGTRACSAYCPYKVRHFNFLHYSEAPASIQAQRNPNVTVRARGVMEKCTYCVQRIVAARIDADQDHRPIRDGEVVTACAAACPTQAITFGNLADKDSGVAKARHDPRNYALLGELNTRPRTTYLAAFGPTERKS
jgi:molybdopterin-containing oxidoreductase family iron-sulfur binding subunit